MSYLDIGFDEFLQRIPDDPQQQMDPSQFDNLTNQISASKIQGGLISSRDGKSQIDLEKGAFKIKNGLTDLITLGKLDDGTVGLLIRDNDGNILMQITGNTNILQSFNKHVILDFNEETFTVANEGGTPIVLLGKIS